MKLMKTVMRLFQKFKKKRKTRRKLKLLEINNKMLHNKFQQKERRKENPLPKVKRNKELLKAKLNLNNKVLKRILNKNQKVKRKLVVMILKNLFLQGHLRAESTNLLIQFHTFHSITQEGVFLRNTN